MLMDQGKNLCTTCGYYGDTDKFIYDGIHSMCTCAGCLAAYDERNKQIPAGF
jgi:hypothetical protein